MLTTLLTLLLNPLNPTPSNAEHPTSFYNDTDHGINEQLYRTVLDLGTSKA